MRPALALFCLLLAACSQIADPQTPPQTTKRIALSFDDAPRGDSVLYSGTDRTRAMIEALAAANIPPTVFFVTTRGMDQPEGRARIERYAGAGHLIANHTHTHPWLRRTEAETYIADLDQAEARLDGITNRRPWFRYPFLDEGRPLERRNEVYAALQSRGLINGYVTVDNYDWYIDRKWRNAIENNRDVDLAALRKAYVDLLVGAVEFYDGVAVDALGRSPAHMLLLHENDAAVYFIGDLVAALRAKGWTIVHPDEVYQDPIAQIEPLTQRTGQGRVAALAIDAGLDPATLSHLAIDENMIDAFLDERGVFGPASKD